MKGLVLFFLAAGLARAVIRYTSGNGVNYEITMTQHGSELPVELSSRPALSTSESLKIDSPGKSRRNNVQSTANWCGMSNVNPPSGYWTNIESVWTVPQISLRSGQTNANQPSIAQWVGIDGDGCGTGLIQGGTVSQVCSLLVPNCSNLHLFS